MADSDNSRTLPTVTRRRLLSTLAVWLAAQTSSADQERIEEGAGIGDDDQVLALWQQWMAAHGEVERLCEAQQRLESQMMRHVGFPDVEIALTDHEAPVPAFSMEEIDLLLGDGPERDEIRATAKSTLAKKGNGTCLIRNLAIVAPRRPKQGHLRCEMIGRMLFGQSLPGLSPVLLRSSTSFSAWEGKIVRMTNSLGRRSALP
ncbi:hypothetical protein [Neorhizobium sp. DT-125]|uniref:hypothetical protein n=1 Tax=Neorhizobium sp. DT-125 TaxID=3396163 RepID=UPI003F1A85F5